MQDKTITCRDCNREFVFTAGEQQSFAEQGFYHDPSRCLDCRAARKARIPAGAPGFRGGFSSGGGFDRRPRQLYPAVCAQCGKDTQVPFQPSGDRPVYCSDCYSTQRSSIGGGYDRRAAGSGRSR